MVTRPGGQIASRPLHFIWILDCSGSMNQDGKIQTLNMAIRQTTPELQATAAKHPEVQLLIRAVRFYQRTAEWHVPQPTPASEFTWHDVNADGETPMGRALTLVADAMKVPPMPASRAYAPVLILVSDGQPTDDFDAGLTALMAEHWGATAVRLAIAVGRDADSRVLQKFIGNPTIPVLQANNPRDLINKIDLASKTGIAAASAPRPNESTESVRALQADEAGKPPKIVPPPLPNEPVSDTTW